MNWTSAFPEIDASRHYDALDRIEALTDRFEQEVRQEIKDTFTVFSKDGKLRRYALPITSDGGRKEATQKFTDGVEDVLTDTKPWKALMEVLQSSRCPMVDEWRKAMAEQYADRYARDVASVRADEYTGEEP